MRGDSYQRYQSNANPRRLQDVSFRYDYLKYFASRIRKNFFFWEQVTRCKSTWIVSVHFSSMYRSVLDSALFLSKYSFTH